MTPLKVREFSETILGREHLTVLDEDTPRSKISFTLMTVPRYGIFLKDGQEVQQSDAFNVRDVETSRMSYRHVVRGEASDELGLIVDDGAQKASFLLEIGELKRFMIYILQRAEVEALHGSSGLHKIAVWRNPPGATPSLRLDTVRIVLHFKFLLGEIQRL